MSIVHALERHAASTPDRIALHFGDRAWTYGEVDEVTTRLASAFAGFGVGRGDRVAVMLPNWPEFHLASHATWKAGGVEVPINIMFKEEEAAYVLRDSGARVVLASPETAQVVDEVRSELPELRAVVVAGVSTFPDTVGFDDAVAGGPADLSRPSVAADDLAIVAYTSGTTGFPKGAMLRHDDVVVSMEALRRFLDLSARDNVLQVLPCFHSNASLIGVVFAWYLGSSAVLIERFEPKLFVDAVRATRPTYFAFVPTLLHDLVRLGDETNVDFSSVRYINYGAAPCPAHIRDAVEGRFDLRLLQAYGMTEAPNLVTSDPLDARVKTNAVGRPLPHIELQIVDDDGRVLPPGEPGEVRIGPRHDAGGDLVYRPMLGYWRNPAATATALRDGFFHTGDIGFVDDEGYLFIVDRKKDVIIRGGNNIFPAELERVLMSHPDVDEAYVVGLPDARLGELPRAYVVLRDAAATTAEDLRALVRARLAAYKRVDQIEFVDSAGLPRTALGKVLKRELRARAREEVH